MKTITDYYVEMHDSTTPDQLDAIVRELFKNKQFYGHTEKGEFLIELNKKRELTA